MLGLLAALAGPARAQAPPVIDGQGADLIAFAAAIGANGCAIDRVDPRDDIQVFDPKIVACSPRMDTDGNGLTDYFVNGFDLRRCVLVYDRPNRNLYLLWRTEGSIGDSNGDLDPGDTGCPQGNIADPPGIGSNEFYRVDLDTDCSGGPADITILVQGSEVTITGAGAGPTGTFAFSGNDLEVAIAGIDLPAQFTVSGRASSAFDGLGEDPTPAAACGLFEQPTLTVSASATPSTLCATAELVDIQLTIRNTGGDLASVTVVNDLPPDLVYAFQLASTCGGTFQQVANRSTWTFSLAGGGECTVGIQAARTASCSGPQTSRAFVEGTLAILGPCVYRATGEALIPISCGTPPACSIIAPDTSVLPGETVQLCGPEGSYQYAWSTGATTRCISVGAGTYSLAVTSLQDGCGSAPCFVTVNSASPAGLNGTYAVGPGGNFPNVESAVAALASQGVSGPVRFDVSPGVYRTATTLVIPAIAGTSATNRVTFRPASGSAADVFLEATGGTAVVDLRGASFVTLDRLTVRWPVGTSNSNGPLRISLASVGTQVLGCVVRNLSNAGARGLDFASGVSPESLVVRGCDLEGTIYGILSDGSALRNARVEGNRIRAGTIGFALFNWNTPVGTPGLLVANNFITGNSTGMLVTQGAFSSGLVVAHNSVSTELGPALSFHRAVPTTAGPSGSVRILSNILTGGEGLGYEVRDVQVLQGADYNDFYTSGSFLASVGGVYHASLPTLRAATSLEEHSLVGNPGFLSATDLHTNLPALDGAGIAVAGVTTDIDGEPRHPMRPDIGADEFNAVQLALNGTYAVGPGAPYASVQEAVADLVTRGMDGPVTFVVASGTYSTTSPLIVPGVAGANPAQRVTIRSATGNAADVVLEATSGSSVVEFQGADYVTLDRLSLRWPASNANPLLRLTGAGTGLEVAACLLLNGAAGSTAIALAGKEADSLVIRASTIEGGRFGIHVDRGVLRDMVVEGNRIRGGESAVMLLDWTTPADQIGIVLANNFITGPQTGVRAEQGASSGGVRLIHNSLSTVAGPAFFLGRADAGIAGPINSVGAGNNIYFGGAGLAYDVGDPAVVAFSENNDLHTTGTHLASWGGSSFDDLDALKAASSKENASVSVDPGFVSATDLHANALGVDGGALPVPEFSTDIDGEPRDPSTPDMGADEFVYVAPPLTGTYTVGSSGAFPTIHAAVSAAVASGVSGPVEFAISPGTYDVGNLVIPAIGGAGPGARVVFTSATGNAVDVVIEGSFGGFVVQLQNAGHVSLDRVTVRSDVASLLQVSGTSRGTIISGCRLITSGSRAIEISAGSVEDLVIRGNWIEGTSSEGSVYGIVLLGGAVKNVRLEGNRLLGWSESLHLSHWETNPGDDGVLVANNVVTRGGIRIAQATASLGLVVAHNTVSATSLALSLSGIDPWVPPTGSVSVVANILVADDKTYQVDYPSAVAISDYNDVLVVERATLATWGGVDYRNLGSLQAASGHDAHSLSVNPGFVSDSDFHTNLPALDGAAVPVPGVTTDIDGETRNPVAPDIGADEFTPPLPALAGQYTVGPGGDYATLPAAVAAAVARGVSAPVVFAISPGIHDVGTFFRIPGIAGASAHHRVRFISATGNAADVVLQSSGFFSVVELRSASHVSLEQVTLRWASSTSSELLRISGNSLGTVVSGCTIVNSSDYAMEINAAAAESLVVGGNRIEGQRSGLSLLGGWMKDVRIEGNRVAGGFNGGLGVALWRTDPGDAGVLVANNFVTRAGISISQGADSRGVVVAHNTVSVAGTALVLAGSNPPSSSIAVKGNILDGGTNAYQVLVPAAVAGSDYNDILTSGVTLAVWGSASYSDLASFRAATGQDSHSLSVNPGFLSDTDLHTNLPALDGAGIPVPGVTTDIDGETRNSVAPDIGADEFTPPLPPLAGPYLVGAGGAYASVQAAVSDATHRGVSAPVELRILPGTYDVGALVVPGIAGASASNRFRITSSTGNPADVVLEGSVGFEVVELRSASHVSLEGVTIRRSSSGSYALVRLTGNSRGTMVSGCTLVSTGTQGLSIAPSAAESLVVRSNRIEGTSTGLTLIGGVIKDARLEGNRLAGTTFGLQLSQWQTNIGDAGVLASNNFVTRGGIQVVQSTTSRGLVIADNSVSAIGRALHLTRSGTHPAGTIQVRGNVLVGGTETYRVEFPTAVTVSDYNDLVTSGATLAWWGGVAHPTLASLRAAGGQDSHSISVNPQFVSPTDLHTNVAALNGAGTPVAGVTTDIDGDARDPVAPDIGADEFVAGLPKLDLAITGGLPPSGATNDPDLDLAWSLVSPFTPRDQVSFRSRVDGISPQLLKPDSMLAFSNANAITVQPDVPASVPLELFHSERVGVRQGWEFPLPQGIYRLRLLFAETAWSPGQRLFDVAVDGQPFLDDFDAAAFAGSNVGLDTVRVVSVQDGVLDLGLVATPGSFDQAPEIKGIEIAAAADPGRVFYRVNCGGPALPAADGSYPHWSADDATAAYSPWSPDSSLAASLVGAGGHHVEVEARAPGLAVEDTVRAALVYDPTPPDAIFLAGPNEGAWFGASTTGILFEAGVLDNDPFTTIARRHRVDDGPWSPPGGSSFTVPIDGLPEGTHHVDVVVTDRAGNEDPTPAIRTIRIDRTAPDGQFVPPPLPGVLLHDGDVTLRWRGSDDAITSGLRYDLVGNGTPHVAATTDTFRTLNLGDGPWTFVVTAIDSAGNRDATPDTLRFTVDTTGPTVAITLGPTAGECVSTPVVTFHWGATDVKTPADALRFATKLDAGPFVDVGAETTATFGPLARGGHTFTVRATDLGGNVSTASRSFTVDAFPPVAFPPSARLLDAALVRFQCTAEDSTGVTAIRLQVATTPDFSALVVDQVLGPAGQYDHPGAPGATYWFRASASDCAGNVSTFVAASGPISIPNLPDLVVSEVETSENAVVAGQSFGVNWIVLNQAQGGTLTPNWTDRIYLSADTDLDLDGTDVALAEFPNVTHLAPGESYARDLVLTLPRGIGGQYRVLTVTDTYDELAESLGTNNVGVSGPLTVTPADAADLEVLAVQTVPFDEWVAGSSMQVEWTVRNRGPVPPDTDRWYDTVFLSDDDQFDVQVIGQNQLQFADRPLGSFLFTGALDGGGTYTQQQRVRLPLDVQPRNYWLFVVADHRVDRQNEIVPQLGGVFENGADLNASAAFRIAARTRPPANLTFGPGSVDSPGDAQSGQAIPVTWTVTNEGDTTVVDVWVDEVWLSADESVDPSDVLLGSQTRNSALSQFDSYTVTLPVTLPQSIAGTYRVLVRTDAGGYLVESNESDNVGFDPVPLVVTRAPAPDLLVLEAFAPSEGAAGGTIGVRWRVDNRGEAAAAGSWSDRVYVRPGTEWAPSGATALRDFAGSDLPRSGSYTREEVVGLPVDLAAGAYTLWIVADAGGHVFEDGSEANNVRAAGQVAIAAYPPVDLVVEPLSAPAAAGSGSTVSVSWRVRNAGKAATPGTTWRDHVALSEDLVLGPGDPILATIVRGGALAAGDSYVEEAQVTVPNGIQGPFHLLVRTDVLDQSGDGNPANDVAAWPDPLVVTLTPPPDLEARDVHAGGAAIAGQPFTLEWVEANADLGPTLPGAWTTYVYLSVDPIYGNDDDQLVASRPVGSPLAGGETRAAEVTFDVPHHFAGPYYAFVRIDATRVVFESDEHDNVALSPPINVSLAPPADLVVVTASAPDSVVPGRAVLVRWTLANQGVNPAKGVIRDVVYVSKDEVFDPRTDPVLGLVARTVDVAPQGTVTIEAVVQVERTYALGEDGELVATVPTLSPGRHHVFVRTNVLRNIREQNYENNVLMPPVGIEVAIPDLPVGGNREATLARGEAAYWRIDVPSGQDLEIRVASSQPGATNELFASFGLAPDPRTFEFSGPAEYTPTPSINVPSTHAGSYFIRVSNNALPPGVTNTIVTVSARLLPYSITAITPDVAGGAVTCTIRGAGFTPATRFALRRAPLPTIEGGVVDLVNSGLAFVRFDVGLGPPGECDLVATTGDSVFVVPAGFTIEPGTPLDVETTIEAPDVIRQNATATITVRMRNRANRDVPFLRARVLLAPEVQVAGMATTGGLLRRSDLWPEEFTPLSGDLEMLRRTDGTDSLRAIDLVAHDVPPGEDLTLVLGLRGFARGVHSVRALVRLDERSAFLGSLVAGIEAARLATLSSGQLLTPDLEALLGDPFATRDSALSRTWVASGVLGRKAVTQYVKSLPAGDLGAIPDGGVPPELEPGAGPCALPSDDPGCALTEAVASELPPCRSCFDTRLPLALFLPGRLDVSLPVATCTGYRESAVRDVEVVSPCDPNLIASTTTPAAFGTILGQRWLPRSGEIEYTVFFENTRETATAAAKDVRVNVPIPAVLDPVTFRLVRFWLGAGDPNSGLGYVSSFSPRTTFQDEFQFGSVVVATQLIPPAAANDSATFLFSTTAAAGFLPVNDASQRGQGGVVFRIRPRVSATTGERVAVLARIRFDNKPALQTNVDSLRIDAMPPSSRVTSAVAFDQSNVRVRWSGEDDPQGTGIRTYDLYSRRGSDPFQLVLADVPGTEATLPLLPGESYGFYTRARDHTQNLQPVPPPEQVAALTLPGVVGIPDDGLPRAFALYQNRPNPFRGESVIHFDLPAETEVTLDVYDVAGRRVSTLLHGLRMPAGRHQARVDGRSLRAGVYFYRLRAGGQVSNRKMILLGN